jgi:hypothetical protein
LATLLFCQTNHGRPDTACENRAVVSRVSWSSHRRRQQPRVERVVARSSRCLGCLDCLHSHSNLREKTSKTGILLTDRHLGLGRRYTLSVRSSGQRIQRYTRWCVSKRGGSAQLRLGIGRRQRWLSRRLTLLVLLAKELAWKNINTACQWPDDQRKCSPQCGSADSLASAAWTALARFFLQILAN